MAGGKRHFFSADTGGTGAEQGAVRILANANV